jgi:hypothetical protein
MVVVPPPSAVAGISTQAGCKVVVATVVAEAVLAVLAAVTAAVAPSGVTMIPEG